MQCKPDSAGLVFGLFKLRDGVGVRDDAGTHMIVEVTVFVNQSADRDVELGLLVEPEETHRTGVKPARDGFKFGDDFSGPLLWSTGDGPTGKTGGQRGEVTVFG